MENKEVDQELRDGKRVRSMLQPALLYVSESDDDH